MNNTKSETHEAHSQAILDLLDQCCEHLASLGCPPVHPKHEPDEHDCGHCDRCGGCVNCGNCAACDSCPDPDNHKCCKNSKDAPENKGEGSVDYIIMSVDDFGQLLDDMIALSDTIDGLTHFIHEKEHLAKTLMGIANRLVPSTQEQMLVQAANKTNATISERWDSIELAPIDED